MKITILLIFFALVLSNSLFAQSWHEKNSFYEPQPASAFPFEREEAFVFSTQTNIYCGNGWIETAFSNYYFHDLYSFNLQTNTWSHKNDPTFSSRGANFSFSISSKSYVCFGNNLNNGTTFNECWEYD